MALLTSNLPMCIRTELVINPYLINFRWLGVIHWLRHTMGLIYNRNVLYQYTCAISSYINFNTHVTMMRISCLVVTMVALDIYLHWWFSSLKPSMEINQSTVSHNFNSCLYKVMVEFQYLRYINLSILILPIVWKRDSAKFNKVWNSSIYPHIN